MKKTLIIFAFIGFLVAGRAEAFVSPYPATDTQWGAGDTITSAWLNTIEQMIGTGSTSTPLTSLVANLSSTVSNINFPSSTYAQVANNLSDLTSTSTARLNLGLNALVNALQLIASNNLSDLTSTSTARLNIGLGNLSNALQLAAANNLSDLTNTSTARTNLGLGSIATQKIPGAGFLISTSSVVTSTVLQAGTNITISQGPTSTIVSAAITSSTAAGLSMQVMSNQNGAFYGDGNLTYATSSGILNAENLSVSGTASTTALTISGQPVVPVIKTLQVLLGNITVATNTLTIIQTTTLPAIGTGTIYQIMGTIPALESAAVKGSSTVVFAGATLAFCSDPGFIGTISFSFIIQMLNSTTSAFVSGFSSDASGCTPSNTLAMGGITLTTSSPLLSIAAKSGNGFQQTGVQGTVSALTFP